MENGHLQPPALQPLARAQAAPSLGAALTEPTLGRGDVLSASGIAVRGLGRERRRSYLDRRHLHRVRRRKRGPRRQGLRESTSCSGTIARDLVAHRRKVIRSQGTRSKRSGNHKEGRAGRQNRACVLITLGQKLGEKQNIPHTRFLGDYDDPPTTTRQPQERTSSRTIIDNSPLVSSEDTTPAAGHDVQMTERPSSAALRISEYFSTPPESPLTIPSERPYSLPDLEDNEEGGFGDTVRSPKP